MAVSKIHKISSWTLLILSVISVIIFLLFFFGGVVDPAAALPEPTYTATLLYWTYFVFGLAVVALVVFGLIQFISKLKTNPKGALISLGFVVVLAVLLLITYSIGSTERLSLGADFVQYNTPGWLKMADMWLYSIYVLIALAIIGVIWGGIRNAIKRRG